MTLTFVNKAESITPANGTTTLAATMPTGVSAGDTLIAFIAISGTATPGSVSTVPSGWTLIPGASVSDIGTSTSIFIAAYTKTASASEPTSYTWSGTNVSGRMGVSTLAYRGSDGVPSGHVTTAVQASTSATRTTGNLTIDSNEWVISAFADNNLSETWSTPSGDTLRSTVTSSNANFIVSDSNGVLPAGTYSRTSTAGNSSNLGATIIMGLHTSTNQAPIVNAGPDQNVAVGATVTLSGSVTDPDGTIASTAWTNPTHPGGSAVLPTSPSSVNTTVTLNTPGTYVYVLTATDDQGASTPDSVTITVFAQPTLTVNSNTGQVALVCSMAGGTAPYSYTIDPVPTDLQTIGNILLFTQQATPQTYTVTGMDANNVSDTKSVSIGALTSGSITEVVTLSAGVWS